MRRRIFTFVLFMPIFGRAQQGDTTYKFYSSFVKDSFKITIGRVSRLPADKTFYPVYTLDGDETFTGSKFALNSLHDLTKNILIISIGYGAAYGQKGNKRDRDYSPVKSDTSSGKKFLLFLKNELIPFTEKNYSLKNERTPAGYSAGASFCLYTLLANQTYLRIIWPAASVQASIQTIFSGR